MKGRCLLSLESPTGVQACGTPSIGRQLAQSSSLPCRVLHILLMWLEMRLAAVDLPLPGTPAIPTRCLHMKGTLQLLLGDKPWHGKCRKVPIDGLGSLSGL